MISTLGVDVIYNTGLILSGSQHLILNMKDPGCTILPILLCSNEPVLQGMLAASKTQLVVTLAIIGVLVPLGCYPGLLIMFDLYTVSVCERDETSIVSENIKNFNLD